MFSFSPALPGSNGRFARPALELSAGGRTLVNPRSAQAQYGFRPQERLALDVVANAWREVAEQVLAQGLVLANHLDEPQLMAARDVTTKRGELSS